MRGRQRQHVPRGRSLVGERYTVDVGPVAHGGHCVARHEGRVVFVRHAIPGERVVARVTEGEEGSRFLRADAVEILRRSPDRVEPPCPFSGPGRCGGCDFQHVRPSAQREMKANVVREQFLRLAGLDVDVAVEPVPGDDEGLGWRTRVQFAVDSQGYAGLRKHRSHEVVRIDHCPISHPALPPVLDRTWPGARELEAIRSSTGEQLSIETSKHDVFVEGPEVLHEDVVGRRFEVTGSGFWQIHPGAAVALLDAVVTALDPKPGESAADLYSGVGLFTATVAERVGVTGRVVAVESDATAAEDAARNLADLGQVETVTDRVERALRRGAAGERCDLVVLDPPRVGAKREVVERVVELAPRAVSYVACDPGALARDVAIFAEHGYRLSSLRAFDIFPMTHHVECVALLERG
ncbi:MAG TPA: class I SAM-dependent RNA methyltransferase [Nocardioidaceae bacterium]|nr:class I SAM-dependent RNA methyltransferase [Nocardioidaceae bacterium]